MDSLQFLYLMFFIIVIYIIAGLITAAFVIPLQIKENGVKNGLAMLRRQMLLKGILSIIVIIISILALSLRYVIDDINILRYLLVFMVLLHALAILGKSYIDYKIYHQQYTDKNKQIHEKIESEENKLHKN